MKKNKMMRTASALLVLVLLTTCIISGTFAKYTTSASGSDTARVAYWGFDNAASIDINLFDGEYTNTANDETVKSSNNDNVIAPGTSKEATFAFGSIYTKNNGKSITAPEVDYKFTVEPALTGTGPDDQNLLTKLDNNPNFKWTLKAPGAATANKYENSTALVNAIKNMEGFNNGTKVYKADTLPEIFTDTTKAYTIGWVWDFETADDNTTTNNEMEEQDAADTAMGNAGTLENITFTITVTATQID